METGYNTDMICASLAVGYESYLNKAQKDGVDPSVAQPTEAEMLAMIERTRRDNKNSHDKETNSVYHAAQDQ